MAVVRPVALPVSSGQVLSTPTGYYGFSLANSSSSANAQVLLYEGTDATGTLFEIINLAPSESAREDYPNQQRKTAIYAAITGTPIGVLKLG